jgi:hypothetical protein
MENAQKPARAPTMFAKRKALIKAVDVTQAKDAPRVATKRKTMRSEPAIITVTKTVESQTVTKTAKQFLAETAAEDKKKSPTKNPRAKTGVFSDSFKASAGIDEGKAIL